MLPNSPRKSLTEWRRTRDSAPQTQPQPPASRPPTEPPHRHTVDLLRNRDPNAALGAFDGRVAAFAEIRGEHYFVTTNTDYVPALPSLETPHAVYLRSDMRYGTDDPTLWPQQWTERYCHMPLIAKKGARADLAPMWWDPSPRDWVVGSAVTRGLGWLQPRRVSPLVDVVNKLVERCTQLRTGSSESLHPLFAELIQHILMWLEQLQSLPTTFPKMLFALTSLQREVLELDALYEYFTVYKDRMAKYAPGSAPSVAQCVGTFTTSPMVAQQLWAAGIPFWFLRPVHVFDAENILEVVPLLEPSFGLPDADAHGVGAPPALYSGNSTLAKIEAIHRAALYTPWYHDPFETGFDRDRSPSPPPIASSSAVIPQSDRGPQQQRPHARAPEQRPQQSQRYKPYPSKNKAPTRPPKDQRDKFVALTAPELPPPILCMVDALAQVDRAVAPYTRAAADTRYVLPEPALFANNNLPRRHKWLHHWKLLRDAFLFMLTQRPHLLSPQQWRDVLEGRLTKRGLPNSREYKRSQVFEDVLRPALQASGLDRIEGFPVPDQSVPQFTLNETREIIWEVAEIGFRFEFCALDRRASGKERVSAVKDCFAGHMFVGIPLHLGKQGWAATALEERHRYVARTARLMLDWITKSPQPSILQRIVDHRPWSSAHMQELETAVCRYYTQAFWEHFGRAAVLPMRLDHDLEEKEEGEL
ncbi:hypothetical protein C8F04DRAFT_1271722 [Mycena alexandri]|uniref:Uncharacterized protein n=1 Tax=Mycena alexandri TaxID=1745969 RepID=A0AAD6S8G1_9AGAR|nr:hypothetical protein C8F04DRAFT_1271722 [Mycena alexandri]